MDSSTRNSSFEFGRSLGVMGWTWRQVKPSFSPFFTIFGCLFFNAECAVKLKYLQKLWQKNEEKPCSSCLKFIFRLILGTRKSDFVTSSEIRIYINSIFFCFSFPTHQNFTSLTFVFFFEQTTNEKSKIIQWKISKSEGKKNYGRPFFIYVVCKG